jgi:hypothetical protein
VQHCLPACATSTLQPAESFHRIDVTKRTATLVASEYLLAKIAGISPQAPFVNAPLGTEREAASWNFQRTPTAQCASTRAFWKLRANGATARHLPLRTHNRKSPVPLRPNRAWDLNEGKQIMISIDNDLPLTVACPLVVLGPRENCTRQKTCSLNTKETGMKMNLNTGRHDSRIEHRGIRPDTAVSIDSAQGSGG